MNNTAFTPEEVKITQMALITFIEDNEHYKNNETIPFNEEAKRMMNEMSDAANSALAKIQKSSNYKLEMAPYEEGDEEEFLTK